MILYAVVVLVAVVLAFVLLSTSNAQKYNELVSKENPNDICAVPSGYTEQQWKDHMSHHPDRYAQCPTK